jgi:anti-sigma regulatory factor (Ser/Thr protein kinase)
MADIHRITRAAYAESLKDFRDFIKEHCGAHPRVDSQTLYDIQLAVDEACTNIITHGYANMDPGSIILNLEIETEKLRVYITDFGHSFEPDNTPIPDVTAPLEERPLGGFGIFFIRQLMDHMEYQVTEDGNTMVLTKLFNRAERGTE